MTEVQFLLFLLASLIVILTPGQDMVLVMSRGISQGARAGILTAAGVSVGLLGHTLLAGFGLGSLLMASETLFTILKFVGAAYLLYLGGRLLLSSGQNLNLENAPTRSKTKLFMEGAISNISNPKITIFYFAFLPQFISAETADPTLWLLILGATFALLTFMLKAPVGYFSGMASNWIRQRPGVLRWIDRTSGTVLVALGLKLALEDRG